MRAKFHAAGVALGRQHGEENFPRRMAGTRLLRVHNYVVTSSVAFTRSLWARRGPFRHLRMHTAVPEDLDLWLRFFDEVGGGEAAAVEAGRGVLPASAQNSSSSSSSSSSGGTAPGGRSGHDPGARGVYLPEPLVYYDAGDYDGASAAAAGEGAGEEVSDDANFE